MRSLASAVAVAAALALAGRAGWSAEPGLAIGPDQPGPQQPASGRSLFDELFATPDGYDIPFPFERILQAIDARIAPARVRTALFPLGRSLQRFAADPGYFESPRLVVAVAAEGAAAAEPAPGELLLRDRLYLGYQPAAETIEAISYNEAAGRFEFQEITDYSAGQTPRVAYATREFCVACHQGQAPIFSRPLWSESNANPAIAARMAGLGATFHGAPVAQGIDGLDDFDRSTDRANRIAVINLLWDQGCGTGPDGAACRAMLFKAALRYRLTGARAEWQPAVADATALRLHRRLGELWPGGLAIPSPDLPNRDPLPALATAQHAADILETTGAMNPETRRGNLLLWTSAADAPDTLGALARDVAESFAASDIAWLDARLAAASSATQVSHRAPCRLTRVPAGMDRTEFRVRCGGGDDGIGIAGHVVADRQSVSDGRIDEISVGRDGTIRRLAVAGGTIAHDGDATVIGVVPRESGAGLSARLPSGGRIAGLRFDFREGGDSVEMEISDDMPVLDAAIDRLVAADAEALGPGPLRRRALLAALAQTLAIQ